MKKALLAATALTALSATAFAADLPKRAVAPASPAPIFSWTGAYVGATAGGVWLKSQNSYSAIQTSDEIGDVLAADSARNTGILGGVTLGYNYQINNLVVGVEGDYSLTSASNYAEGIPPVVSSSGAPDFSGGPGQNGQTKMASFGTARVRLGYAIDRTLLFVTGGLAFANLKYSSLAAFPDANDLVVRNSKSTTAFGWVVGAGIEHAINNNWTLKAEALYANLGTQKINTPGSLSCCTSGFKTKTTATVARVGLNYKF